MGRGTILFVNGGAIVEGDDEKDPAVLADELWQLHVDRTTLRVQVSAD